MAYRAALIGCGNIGSLYAEDPLIKGIYTHAGAYTACSETTLVAVCDVSVDKAKRCADKWNVSAIYTNVSKLLAEQKPEIVSVCTPDHTHAEVLEEVLNAPSVMAILAEKPLALDKNQALNLVHLAKKKEILLAVNYSRRYSEGHRRIKKLIQTGKIGNIQSVSGFYTKGIFHNGTHWLDLARWLIGEIIIVQGFDSRRGSMMDPALNAWLKFESGAEGFLQHLAEDAFSLFEIDIVGTHGRIRITDSGHHVEYYQVAPSLYYSGYKTLHKIDEQEEKANNTLFNAVSNLVSCLKNKEDSFCTGADAVAVLHIASALKKSAQKGEKIIINCKF